MNNIFLPIGTKLVNLNYLQSKMIYASEVALFPNGSKCEIYCENNISFEIIISLPELLNLLEMKDEK